jgi:hypothetical protein
MINEFDDLVNAVLPGRVSALRIESGFQNRSTTPFITDSSPMLIFGEYRKNPLAAISQTKSDGLGPEKDA